MATNDPVALLLSHHSEEPKRDETAYSLRILKPSILAAAIGLAILLIGNPLLLFASAPAPSASASAPPGPSIPTFQPTPGEKDPPQIETTLPTRNKIAAAFDATLETQTETRQPSAAVLLGKFQAWAAEEDARSAAQPAQPAQGVRPRVAKNDRAQLQPLEKHRQVRSRHTSRAEARPVKKARAHVRFKHNARTHLVPKHRAELQARRMAKAASPEESVHDAWIRWSERPFGWINRISSSGRLGIPGVAAVSTTRRGDDF